MRDALDEAPDPPDWVSPDYTSPTDPTGNQSAAPDDPVTTVDAAEETQPPPGRSMQAWRRPVVRLDWNLNQLATQILDTLDTVGDRIAEGLGLR